MRQLARCLQAICRKVALGLETGDASLVRDRVTAAQVRALLGEPDAAHSDGLGGIRRAREYLDRLLSVPWTARTEAPLDLARAHAVLDAGHAGHEAVKQRLLDQLAVRVSNPGAGFQAICLSGSPGVGKSALARLVAAALRRPCAWLPAPGWARPRWPRTHASRSGPASGRASRPSEPAAGSVGRIASRGRQPAPRRRLRLRGHHHRVRAHAGALPPAS